MAQIHLPDTSTVANLDIARLAAKDASEVARLLEATQNPGFFYLDFRNEPTMNHVAQQARGVYTVTEEYFDQPTEVKMKDVREGQPASSDRGYKSCETDESFEMSTDEMRRGTLTFPALMEEQAQLVNNFHSGCHDAAHVLLARLADALSLPLQEKHRSDQSSESGLKLIAEPTVPLATNVLENKHRDSGTLTMLFYDRWGVQVCLSGEDEEERQQKWVFVQVAAA
ncbi:uncharacterized protein HRG_07514 [Hirsutella rhossiliensis]|uniref:Non-haem dioxygenase N-terminal domain-containing protein n=1 Tax=Hirsutella rhossiliensis TaxID=111463 RepID=A0A9P8MWC8_9HYPO|nr:uncharacterized protein HRG_07514 [Hirsutella rhossiliensis]KAH0961436.1 hypothetical protein HRG_07514 [Hirsutella rhossiliensis]